MSIRQRIAEQLLAKEERISSWERQGLSNGSLDRNYCELPKIEYWYMEDR